MGAVKSTVLVLGLTLIFVANVGAEVITIFDSNATISAGQTYDTVVVKGDGTVVDMTGGDVNSVITMNASIFNVSGGNISQDLTSYDSSVVNLSDGDPPTVATYGLSTVNVFGNVSISSCYAYNSSVVKVSSHSANLTNVYLREQSTLNLLAGSLNYVTLYHSATLNMSGGNIGTLRVDEQSGNTKINISGGTTTWLEIEGSSLVRLSGGVISELDIADYPWEGSKFDVDIDIVGYDLSAVPYGGTSGDGQVTGFWNNDVNFNIPFYGRGVYSYITLYDGVIPPDCVNKPDSDLNEDCKVNFFDFSEMASEWLDCGLDDPNAC